MKEKPINVSG